MSTLPKPARPVSGPSMTGADWSDRARIAAAANRTWDVIVVGAGVAGTIAARQLARQGRSVLLVEKSTLPRDKVCGGCLSTVAMADLTSIGLGDLPTRIGGVPLTTLELRRDGRRVCLKLPGGVAVSRLALDVALADEAERAGATIVTSVTASLLPLEDGAETNHPTAQNQPGHRQISLTAPGMSPLVVGGRAVLIATGLGPFGVPLWRESTGGKQPIATLDPGPHPRESFRRFVKQRSRIGLGCLLETEDDADKTDDPWPDLALGVVRMVGGPGGYVGIVRVERNRFDLAAAVDAGAVAAVSGPAGAVAIILRSAGLAVPETLAGATWRGTAALTRRTVPVSSSRVLLLGDATGYVEPFTGEGMGWAIAQAIAAAKIVNDALASPTDRSVHDAPNRSGESGRGDTTKTLAATWTENTGRRWEAFVARSIRPRQQGCRRLAWILRRTWASRLALTAASISPALANRVIHRLHVGPVSWKPFLGKRPDAVDF